MADAIAAHIPGVHRVESLLKRWLLGTHQGTVKSAQLEHYIDEFILRFNRRTSRSRDLIFYQLLEQAVRADPITYRQIAKKISAGDLRERNSLSNGACSPREVRSPDGTGPAAMLACEAR